MKRNFKILLTSVVFAVGTCTSFAVRAQYGDAQVIQAIIEEANNNSQLEILGQELLDDIGPRLIGSPQMVEAQNWVMNTYKKWGINAWTEVYGQWKAWERGVTTVEMTSPRTVQLNATQFAWSPSTNGKAIQAEVVVMPNDFKDQTEFNAWLKTIKGKIVLISNVELSGRPEANWEKFATPEDFEAYKTRKESWNKKWNDNLSNLSINLRTLPKTIEDNGAVALVSSMWAGGWSSYKIVAARTEKIPHINMGLEDYAMLHRLVKRDKKPVIKLTANSLHKGMTDAYNTISEFKSPIKPEEIVLLSAHLDSWDAGTGATDNATGTLLMMEVMRILKKVYPQPKRTIMVGHWGGEEQGINGSASYVEDHPELMERISLVLNQDNGTGRINWINGNGFLHAYDYFGRWLKYVPESSRNHIKTNFPGDPGGRASSDYFPFLTANVPAFFLIGENWDYSHYTWHTAHDTYDKIVWEDMRKNVVTIAILTYLACEEPEMFNREKANLPYDINKNQRNDWPKPLKPNRTGQ